VNYLASAEKETSVNLFFDSEVSLLVLAQKRLD